MQKAFAVYILASRRNGAIYVGVTSNLPKRAWEHRMDFIEGHCKTYRINRLVYFEPHESATEAIHREKCIKKWRRAWKVKLIESFNPEWRDLYEELI